MSIVERFYRRIYGSADGDFHKVLRELEQQGWRVTYNGHYKAYPPDKSKPIVTMSSSPSDYYALKKQISDLKKSGYIPGVRQRKDKREEAPSPAPVATLEDVVGKPSKHRDYAAEQFKQQDDEMAKFLFDAVGAGEPEGNVHQIVEMINDEQIKRGKIRR
jgi:hypothetical protein